MAERIFKLNADEFEGAKKLGAQPQLIVDAMNTLGECTVSQIADHIKAKLVTRQEPERVVNFYMSTWKKAGKVSVVGETAPVSTGRPSNVEGPEDIASATDGQFNYKTASLKDAVYEALQDLGGLASAQDIGTQLQVKGRTTSVKQVADALNKLRKAGEVERTEDGTYALVADEEADEEVEEEVEV